jgi:hypothetical protein
MGYNIRNYWVFGLFPSSGILENRKHDVSETGKSKKKNNNSVSNIAVCLEIISGL